MKNIIKYLAAAAILVWVGVACLPDDKLHLVFCNVGQGDAILARYRNTQILVDTGPDGKAAGCLTRNIPFFDRTIEVVVLTHPEKDHIGGLSSVIQSYSVVQIVIEERDDLAWERIGILAREKGIEIAELKRGETIRSGKLKFTAAAKGTGDTNEESLAGRLEFGKFSAILTGDAEARVLGWATAAELLKVPHHGSREAVTPELLGKINPKLAVISVGKNNFGHPDGSVLETLDQAGVRVLRTDVAGEVEIVSDGQRWWVK